MNDQQRAFEFGPFLLDTTERLLLRDGRVVPLTPKVVETLIALVEKNGHIVGKETLMERLWPNTFVEDGSLIQNVSILRRALSYGNGASNYIETIPRRGYRFAADVKESNRSSAEFILAERTRKGGNGARQDELPDAGVAERLDQLDGEPRIEFVAAVEKGVTQPSEISPLPSHHATLFERFNRHRLAMLLVTVGTGFALVAATLAIRRFAGSPSSVRRISVPHENMSMARLTLTGKTQKAVISPDGHYVAYVMSEGGQQSVWVMSVPTASAMQIVQPSDAEIVGLSFTRDGSQIYYVAYPRDQRVSAVYQIPVIGGSSRKLLTDVDSPITVSPDGTRLAFIRQNPIQKESSLFVVNADGTAERKLASRILPDSLSLEGPAWSPDGASLACGALNARGRVFMSVTQVNVADGSEKRIGLREWFNVGKVEWTTDGESLVMVASTQPMEPRQLWELPTSGSEPQKITNDVNDYKGVSLSEDAKTLVTVDANLTSSILVASKATLGRTQQVSSNKYDGYFGLCWTPQGRIIYTSSVGTNQELWVMDADGSNKTRLTVSEGRKFSPAVSPDGRYIVFTMSSGLSASHIWRVDTDGGSPKQLTSQKGERFPQFSADSKWIVYTSFQNDIETLWKINIEGGEPNQLTDVSSTMPSISPDGKLIAFRSFNNPELSGRITIIPFEGGPPLRVLDLSQHLDPFVPQRWSADSRMLIYVETKAGVSNIWGQSLENGPASRLTNFTSDSIFSFDPTFDGKQLAFVRGARTSDAVIVKNFRSGIWFSAGN
jgi:Tol biopolymer transport system component/DNA-binding winged helix-turn-helix (wHTH) protein